MLHFALPNISALLCFLRSHASKQCPVVTMESERMITIHDSSAGYTIRLTGQDSKQYDPKIMPKITCNKQGKVVDLTLPDRLEICSVPLTLQNGVITSSRPNDQALVLQNDVLTHNCNVGFALVGTVKLTCESTGNFDKASPVCKKICSAPSSPANGVFTSSRGTVMKVLEFDELTFSCNSGYQIDGPAKLTCLWNGNFDLATPLCKRICPSPAIIAHASIITPNTTSGSTNLVLENETVEYTCDLGYYLVGYSILNCLADGSYDLTEPVCKKICNLPLQLEDEEITSSEPNGTTFILEDEVVTYSCNSGFALVGAAALTCDSSGSYDHDRPFCKKTCPNPIEPANGGFTSNATWGQMIEMDIVNVTCNSGYLIEGSSLLSCLSTGEFDLTMPSCKKICPSPPFVQHATVATSNGTNISANQVLEMETVTYTCNSGYYLVGNAHLTCLEIGSYNLAAPVCKKICGSPLLIEDGLITSTGPNGITLVVEDEALTHTCNVGFALVGAVLLTCDSSGTYDNDPPICKKICQNLTEPVNGVLTSNATSGQILELDIVNVTCNSFYQIEGASLLTCLSTGQFDLTTPSCKRICLRPPIVQHASVATSNGTNCSANQVLEMETVTYTCNSGYQLVGNANISCSVNGSYNLAAPVCKKICSAPAALENGAIISSGPGGVTLVLENEVVTYTCNNDFAMVGANALTCSAAGNYSYDLPVCKIVCPVPIAPLNGSIAINGTEGQVLELDQVTFSCNYPYVLHGPAMLICLLNGSYDLPSPECKHMCEIPDIERMFSITDSDNTSRSAGDILNVNETITVTCNQIGRPRFTMNCTENGLEVPKCRNLCEIPDIERMFSITDSDNTSRSAGYILYEDESVTVTCNQIGRPRFTMNCTENGLEVPECRNAIYLIGGSVDDSSYATSIAVFYPESPYDSYIMDPKLKDYRDGHVSFKTTENRLFVIGGGFGSNSAETEIYDPETQQWLQSETLNSVNFERSVINRINDNVFVCGGVNNKICHKYSEAHDNWVETASFKGVRYLSCSFVLENRIYVVGGYPPSSSVEVLDLDKVNPTWQYSVDFPNEIFGCGATSFGGFGYVCGVVSSTMTSNNCFRYNPNSKSRWIPIASMAEHRFYFHLVESNNIIYAILGHSSNDYSDTIEWYDPAGEDKWTVIEGMGKLLGRRQLFSIA